MNSQPSQFSFSIGHLSIYEINPNEAVVRNELIGKEMTFSTDNGSALELALEVLFKHTGLDQATVLNSFENTHPGFIPEVAASVASTCPGVRLDKMSVANTGCFDVESLKEVA